MNKTTWIIIVLVVIVYILLLPFGQQILVLLNILPTDAKTIADILRSLTESVAIIVAGYWAYIRFIKGREETREDYPYLEIQHKIEDYELRERLIYLSVFVTVSNQGKRKLDIGEGIIFVRKVIPLPTSVDKLIKDANFHDIQKGKVKFLFIDKNQRIGWETLGVREWDELPRTVRELEPGQTREFQVDFLLQESVKVVEVISYFNKKEGWGRATLYSLKSGIKI